MKLYSYFRSSAAYRVRIALNLKGLDHDIVAVNLLEKAQRDPQYLRVNPMGLVPALDHDGTTIAQSLAIIEYLDDVFPSRPIRLADPAQRALDRSLALTVACDIHPLNNLRVLGYLTDPLGLDAAARDAWYRHWVVEGLAALEQLVIGGAVRRRRGAGIRRHLPRAANVQCPSIQCRRLGISETGCDRRRMQRARCICARAPEPPARRSRRVVRNSFAEHFAYPAGDQHGGVDQYGSQADAAGAGEVTRFPFGKEFRFVAPQPLEVVEVVAEAEQQIAELVPLRRERVLTKTRRGAPCRG